MTAARARKQPAALSEPKSPGAAPASAGLTAVKRGLRNFKYFCGLLRIKTKKGGTPIPLRLSSIQKAFCDARTGRDIILKPRQVYMTTLELARDLWFFLGGNEGPEEGWKARDGVNVVILCQSDTANTTLTELHDRMTLYIESLQALGLDLTFGRESTGNWSLPNQHSTMKILVAGASAAAAVKKGRGQNIHRLHSTESAVFEYPDETFNALLESIGGPEFGTEIVHEATANGAGGWYYEQWQGAVRGATGYKAHFYRWWDHADYRVPLDPGEVVKAHGKVEEALVGYGVTPEQLKWYRRQLAGKGGDAAKMRQEYPSDPETCFLVSGRSFFDIDKIEVMIQLLRPPTQTEMHDALRIYKKPVEGREYILAADPAEGGAPDGKADSADYSASPVFDRETGEHVATLHGRFPPLEYARMLKVVGTKYNEALIAVERNNHGYAVHVGLVTLDYKHIYHHDDEKMGWPTNTITRPVMLDGLDDLIRQGLFSSPCALLVGELRTFVFSKSGKPQAAPGSHDDMVMATAIGQKVRQRPSYANEVPLDVSAFV